MIILRLFLGVAMVACCFGDKFSILQNKIYAMETSLHQDIQLLRANVALHNEEILKMVEFMNATMSLFSNRQDLFGKETSSTIETSSTNAENMQYKNTDTAIDKRVDEEIRVIKRALHDEKRYTRDLHTDLNGKLESIATEQSTIHVKLDSVTTEQTNINVKLDSMSTEQSNINDNLGSIIETLTDIKQLFSTEISTIKTKIEEEHSKMFTEVAELRKESKQIHSSLDISDTSKQTTGLGHAIKEIVEKVSSVDFRKVCASLNLPLTSCSTNECCMQLLMSTYTQGPFIRRGNVRLVNISYESQGTRLKGRLEVLHDEEWGTVCDDSFENMDATVACREFGYTSGEVKGSAFFGKGSKGSGRVWLDNVACVGTESSILHCPNRGFGVEDCSHNEDVGVLCVP